MQNQAITEQQGNIKLDDVQRELGKCIARWTASSEVYETEIPGLTLFHHENSYEPKLGMHEPSICIIAQGANNQELKRLALRVVFLFFLSILFYSKTPPQQTLSKTRSQ